MSYTIVYDRRFIKCGELFIPMALFGDNNVTEYDYRSKREVRVRRWDTFVYSDEMLLAPAGKIMEIVSQFHPKKSNTGESFVFHGKWMDDAATYRWFENGIKDAMSIEDIAWQTNQNTLVGEIRVYQEGFSYDSALSSKQEYLHSTKEITEWVENAKKRKAELLANAQAKSVYICLGFIGTDPLHVSVIKNRTEPYVAQCRRLSMGRAVKLSYVEKIDSSRTTYTEDIDKAYVFKDIEDAYAAIPRWVRDYIKLVPLSTAKAAQGKPKGEYVLTAVIYGHRVYIQRRTSRSTYYTSYLEAGTKRFHSEKEALRWFKDKLEGKSHFSDPVVEKVEKSN